MDSTNRIIQRRDTSLAQILLKCRPTPDQMADRLAEPTPDGVELYLDTADLTGDGWLERTVDIYSRQNLPPDFTTLVEAPIRTIDGRFFDLTNFSDGFRETTQRVCELGRALGAKAANIHAIAPRREVPPDWAAWRAEAIDASEEALRYYAGVCGENALTPLIENIPPFARQREQVFFFTPIGTAVEDLVELANRVSGIGFTIDLSHARLYLNALRASVSGETLDLSTEEMKQAEPFLRSLGEYRRKTSDIATTLTRYLEKADGKTVAVHVSNASGLLGEGLAYDSDEKGEGDVALDSVIEWLLPRSSYIVTETIDADPNHATGMRLAQSRMLALRAGITSRQMR